MISTDPNRLNGGKHQLTFDIITAIWHKENECLYEISRPMVSFLSEMSFIGGKIIDSIIITNYRKSPEVNYHKFKKFTKCNNIDKLNAAIKEIQMANERGKIVIIIKNKYCNTLKDKILEF